MVFTHIDQQGNARMVDVSEKEISRRTAGASGKIRMSKECFRAVQEGTMGKGDVLTVAQVAGIMGLKKTSELIPLCHTLTLTRAEVTFRMLPEENAVQACCRVTCDGKTGVEMEALTGCTTALLTVYDMCKAVDKTMVLEDIHLVTKTGGKSGDFFFEEEL